MPTQPHFCGLLWKINKWQVHPGLLSHSTRFTFNHPKGFCSWGFSQTPFNTKNSYWSNIHVDRCYWSTHKRRKWVVMYAIWMNANQYYICRKVFSVINSTQEPVVSFSTIFWKKKINHRQQKIIVMGSVIFIQLIIKNAEINLNEHHFAKFNYIFSSNFVWIANDQYICESF